MLIFIGLLNFDSGMASQILVPPPMRDLIAILQPCVSANWRAIASPKPLPRCYDYVKGQDGKMGEIRLYAIRLESQNHDHAH